MTKTCGECPWWAVEDRELPGSKWGMCRYHRFLQAKDYKTCKERRMFESLRDEVRRLRAGNKSLGSDLEKTKRDLEFLRGQSPTCPNCGVRSLDYDPDGKVYACRICGERYTEHALEFIGRDGRMPASTFQLLEQLRAEVQRLQRELNVVLKNKGGIE